MKVGSLFICPKQMLANGKQHFIISICLLMLLPVITSFAQDYPEYEEIALFLDVPNLGGEEIDVLIKGNEVFLPITDLFDFLMIRNIPSPGLDTITGFFINQEATYSIEREKNLIRYGNELYELKPGDLIRTETNLYLRGYYYGLIFGLDCEFSFRNMSVRVNTRLELPAIREMRQQAMRKNMNRLVGEVEADTIIGREYPFFRFGMADWSVNIQERINGPVDSRLNLALGAMIAGGEAIVSLNYNSYSAFAEKQQHYLWRYVNNENRVLRQVKIGKIATGATSSIFDPVVGVQLTNTSTKFRRSFGSYTLSDRTEPEWIVELYVNNELVDFTTADASGFFTFEVPLVYGNTQVRLKFYGPWGEERVREQNITIPFNFIPKKTLEYTVSAGMIQDEFRSKFSRTSVNYGLSRSITIGSGVEYFSSLPTGQVMPFVNGSFRLASNLLLSGEYSPSVRSKGTLTYRLPSSLQFDINYIRYGKGQTAINNNFLEERKVSISMPIRFKSFSAYNRFSINQLVLPTSNYTTSEWLISGILFGVSTNITTYAVYIANTKPYFYSDFSMSFRLPKHISIQPRAQYSYTNKEFFSAKVLVEKRVLKKAYLTASYEQNFRSDMHLIEFGFRYDFKFAQTSFLARYTDRNTTMVQFARGSIINDSQTNYVTSDNRSNVGKGGISIIAFLDRNANGIRDVGEPKAYGLNLRANSGRIEKREQDTTIRIFGLEPYTNCYIEFDQSGFDNIAWRLKHRSMNVAVDPNMIKLVEVPINVVGEAAGMVMIDKGGAVRGIARIIVNFYNKNQKKIGRTLTESDGYFSYFGLNSGTYDVTLDTGQLQKLGMVASPGSINFDIAAILDGDYVDGLDFIIKMDTTQKIKEPEKEEAINMMVYIESEFVVDTTLGSFAIKLGAFKNESEADTLRYQLSTIMGKRANLVFEDEQYKVRINGFNNRHEIEDYFPAIQSKGFNKISIISLQPVAEPRLVEGIPDTVIMYTTKDTTVLVLHEIIKDDTSSSTDSYEIQIGEYIYENEADALMDQISTLQGKEAQLVYEDGRYKVHISGFVAREEIEDYFPVIKSIGISEVTIITLKGIAEQRVVTDIPGAETIADTSILIVHQIIEEDLNSSTDSYVIQVGAFKRKSYANRLKKKLANILDKKVIIVVEDGFYKVRITGFETIYELEKYIPTIVRKGIKEIWIVTLKGMQKQGAENNIVEPITEIIDTFTKRDTTYFIVYESVEEDKTSVNDSYAIQLGAFKRKLNADVLKIKLTTILDREVELILEDGLYKVRITDFQTRDEVDKYIPLLIKNGLTEIRILNLKGIQKRRVITSKTDTIQSSDIDSTKTFIDVKRKKKISIKTVKKVITKEIDEKKKPNIKPRKEVVVSQPPVVERSTIEDRLLEAEYRTGIYEARWPGVEFVIQIAASKSISDPEVIKRKFGLSGEVNVSRADEWYRYSVGHYIKYWQAREYRNILRSRNGIGDAIIVAYKEGKKIMFTDLLAIAENTPLTGLTVRPVLSKAFSVQVMATKDGDILVASIRDLYKVDEEIFKEYDESDGLYRYSIGNFALYTDAAKVRNQIKLLGFKEVFVVGFKDGKRVKDLKTLLK